MWAWLCSLTIEEVTSIVQAVAVTVVAIPTFRGLNSWRLQVLGKKKIELAEEALTLAYDLRSAIEHARHPFSRGGEGQDRPNRDDEPEDRRGYNDAFYSRISRLNESADQFSRLMALRPLFRAYYGEAAQDALGAFIAVRNEIYNAVNELIYESHHERYPDDLRNELRAIIFERINRDNPDGIHQRLDSAVAEIERVCRPVLEHR
jgi:hypothetical protein